jgi:hypothetical protein
VRRAAAKSGRSVAKRWLGERIFNAGAMLP